MGIHLDIDPILAY